MLGKSLLPDGCYTYSSLERGLYFCNTIEEDDQAGSLLNTNNSALFQNIISLNTYKSFEEKNHYVVIYEGYLQSLIHSDGNIEIDPTELNISPLSYVNKINFFKISDQIENNKSKFYNTKTKESVTYFYNSPKEFDITVNLDPEKRMDIIKIYKNGKQGFITNKTIVTPKFESVNFAVGSTRVMVTGENGTGIVNETGELFVPLKYTKVKFNKTNGSIVQWYGMKEDGKSDVYDVNGEFRGSATLR
ncbi:MAG: hypothetical protein ACI87N_000572 [Flavobacteriales bacterium]|jgi:hypothetical protein